MKWAIYYITMIILNILAAVIFFEYINITAISIVPIFILILMLFQAFLFYNSKENEFNTTYSVRSELNQTEENTLFYYNANSMLICVPLLLPFILFFSSGIKFICLIIYLLGYSGALVFRIKNKDKLNNRIHSAENELKIQQSKEELGKWK